MSEVLKRREKSPNDASLLRQYERLREAGKHIQRELRELSEQEAAYAKSRFGITEEDLTRLAQANWPAFGSDYSTSEIQSVAPTWNLDELVAQGYEALVAIADREWLNEQSHLAYRRSQEPANPPDFRLHLVGRQRLLPLDAPPRPQRFAQMLLVSRDVITGRNDVDFFDSPMLATEVAGLGLSLDEIRHRMGPEAKRKLNALSAVSDTQVASDVYELLVGAACVRAGRAVEMLPASTSGKTPDFRIHDQIVPFVLECKRRISLSKHAEQEARHIERLYAAAEPLFKRHRLSVELELTDPVASVSAEEFSAAIALMCESKDDDVQHLAKWGAVRLRRLPEVKLCAITRMFSPAFLDQVFGWNTVQSEWDGLLCETGPTPHSVVTAAESPRCLKWKCNDENSKLKKARGVTSLWADAVKQIPTGEMGGIFIAYEESMRAELADLRTDHLRRTVSDRELHHRASVHVPWTLVSRLYPQAHGNGAPELIESSISLVQDGFEHLVGDFPTLVFYRRMAK
jgi:hypothetical protein